MDGLFLVGLQCQALLPQEASARGQDLKELIQSPVSGRYTNHADKGEEINHRLDSSYHTMNIGISISRSTELWHGKWTQNASCGWPWWPEILEAGRP